MFQPPTGRFHRFPVVAPATALAAALALAVPSARALAADCAVFVATTGADIAGSGLRPTAPCRTITYGIARALAAGRTCVYVQAGNYNEVIVAVGGVDVTGGFDSQWQYHAGGIGAQVTVTGGADAGSGGQVLAVRAHDLAGSVVLSDLTLVSPDATSPGASSYVVHASNAAVTLARVQLFAGNGAPGAPGGAGTDALITAAASSGVGGAAAQSFTSTCDAITHGPGGAGGANTCTQSPSSRLMGAGAGGDGGTMDTNCGVFSFDFNATPGVSGANAAYAPGPFGLGGAAGAGTSSCGAGLAGAAGMLSNGVAGTGGAGLLLAGGFITGGVGGGGGLGENGSGGGGGGGSGGCDNGTDATGAGGGGGGAGGCAARAGGGGGAGGGSSVCVMAVGSSVITLIDCTLLRGAAGAGGPGGIGGRGQSGGAGGAGGAAAGGGRAGGAGGNGAHGGHGGGGGGGAGGDAIGVLTGPGVALGTTNVTYVGGTAGNGGAGGASAPAAPLAERDGAIGLVGSGGVVLTTTALPVAEGEVAGVLRAAPVRPASATAVACDPSVCGFVSVDGPGPGSPDGELAFVSAAPNPAIGSLQFVFRLAAAGSASIGIYDVCGARVRVLGGRSFPAGESVLPWDLRDDGGARVRPGCYWARLEAGGRTFTRALVTSQ